jgi:hypothetical protein
MTSPHIFGWYELKHTQPQKTYFSLHDFIEMRGAIAIDCHPVRKPPSIIRQRLALASPITDATDDHGNRVRTLGSISSTSLD